MCCKEDQEIYQCDSVVVLLQGILVITHYTKQLGKKSLLSAYWQTLYPLNTPVYQDVITELKDVITELVDVIAELTDVLAKLTDVIAELTDVITELTYVITELTYVITELTDVITELTYLITELTDVIAELTDVITKLTDNEHKVLCVVVNSKHYYRSHYYSMIPSSTLSLLVSLYLFSNDDI